METGGGSYEGRHGRYMGGMGDEVLPPIQVPMATVECSTEDEEANFAAIDRLEELDDVTNVEHNMAL